MRILGRLTWTRLAAAAVLLGVVQYIVLISIGMACYPGGSYFDANSTGYKFWLNTLSDLGRTTAINGQNNSTAAFVTPWAAALNLTCLMPLWLMLRCCIGGRGWLAAATVILGLAATVAMIAISIIPADVSGRLHALAVGVAACTALPALVLCTIGMYRRRLCPLWLTALTGAVAAAAAASLAQYSYHFWLGGPWLPANVITEKLLMLIVLGWMVAAALRCLAPMDTSSQKQHTAVSTVLSIVL